MALPTGKLAEFVFNSVTFDADDCIQGFSLNDAINEIVYQCDSMDKGAVGTRAVMWNVSLGLAAADTSKLAALTPGTNASDFEAHPFGDTATYVEITSSDATINQANISGSANGIITVDCVFRLNQVTIQAAS